MNPIKLLELHKWQRKRKLANNQLSILLYIGLNPGCEQVKIRADPKIGWKHREMITEVIKRLMEKGLVRMMSIPDKRYQSRAYWLTALGKRRFQEVANL